MPVLNLAKALLAGQDFVRVRYGFGHSDGQTVFAANAAVEAISVGPDSDQSRFYMHYLDRAAAYYDVFDVTANIEQEVCITPHAPWVGRIDGPAFHPTFSRYTPSQSPVGLEGIFSIVMDQFFQNSISDLIFWFKKPPTIPTRGQRQKQGNPVLLNGVETLATRMGVSDTRTVHVHVTLVAGSGVGLTVRVAGSIQSALWSSDNAQYETTLDTGAIPAGGGSYSYILPTNSVWDTLHLYVTGTAAHTAGYILYQIYACDD